MPNINDSALHNHLLASVPPESLGSLQARLTHVTLTLKQPIYHHEGVIDAVYFVTSGMISMVTNLEDGMQAEVGLIGRGGVAGVRLAYGVNTSFVESMVQLPGTALRIGAREFQHELDVNPPLRSGRVRVLNREGLEAASCECHAAVRRRFHALLGPEQP